MSSIPVGPKNELSQEETKVVLRALGYYQIHLFDEISKKAEDVDTLKAESQNVTTVIKKIHKTIEK
ncbi:MAG: hypothetical protein ACYC7D_13415 [Nitrososphaerales archaeon]